MDHLQVESPKIDAIETLKGLDDGNFAFHLSKELAILVAAVKEQGKKGRLILKLEIVPQPDFAPNAVKVIHDIDTKPPRRSPPFSVRFLDEQSRIVSEDPRQMKLSFAAEKNPAAVGTV